ncbi:MAG: hypothetical protein ACPGN3_15300 [Opitutales bacterium]
MTKRLYSLLLSAGLAYTANAQTSFNNGGGDLLFSTASNWSSGAPSVGGGVATIGDLGDFAVDFTGVSLGDLEISVVGNSSLTSTTQTPSLDGLTLNLSGNALFNGDRLSTSFVANVSEGATLDADDRFAGGAVVNMSGGDIIARTIRGGDFNLTGGLLTLENTRGCLQITPASRQ